jgi:hypothetical protein
MKKTANIRITLNTYNLKAPEVWQEVFPLLVMRVNPELHPVQAVELVQLAQLVGQLTQAALPAYCEEVQLKAHNPLDYRVNGEVQVVQALPELQAAQLDEQATHALQAELA